MGKSSGGPAASGRGTGASGSGGDGADFKSPLTRAEKNAIANYSGNYFARINARLRGVEKNLDPILRNTNKNLENALNKASLSRQRIVFRGLGDQKLFAQVRDGKLKAGSTITEKAYLSTTTRKSSAERFASTKQSPVILRIVAPKGAKGAQIGKLSSISSKSGKNLEREVLFQRGRKLQVVKSEIKDGVAHVTVRVKQ